MRRLGRGIGAAMVLVLAILWIPAAQPAQAMVGTPLPTPPAVEARAAILVDSQTGAILYEKNAFTQLDPASLTKMMTALVVLSHHPSLDRVVTISPRAARTGGSRFHVRTGQQYTIGDLLHGLLLPSGNDASVALAEADAGSVEQFVGEMNMTAQELGAFNTQFENPHGLTAPGHYSTAFDLSLIARAAMANPVFRQIVGTSEFTVAEKTRNQERTIHSSNRLLYEFPGAIGVKTGTTSAAGKCLVAAAERDGQSLLAVVLNSPDRWDDASTLLSWGFAQWHTIAALTPETPVLQVPVANGQQSRVTLYSPRTVMVTVPRQGTFRMVSALPDTLRAPVKRHQVVGTAYILSPVQPPQQTVLQSRVSVKAKPISRRFWEWVSSVLSVLNYQDGAG